MPERAITVGRLDIGARLLRQCDDSALFVGRQHAVEPNAFVIELLPENHERLLASVCLVAPGLADQVCRHAAERGYTFVGPVAIDPRPAADDAAPRFPIDSRIPTVERQPQPMDGPTA